MRMDMAERQVLQRVFARQEEGSAPGNFQQLVHEVRTLISVYRSLLATASGRRKTLLRELVSREESNLACLKGMAVLGGTVLRDAPSAGRRRGENCDLHSCFDGSYRLLQTYMALSAQPGIGVVFQEMAARQGRSCALLTELMGGAQR